MSEDIVGVNFVRIADGELALQVRQYLFEFLRS